MNAKYSWCGLALVMALGCSQTVTVKRTALIPAAYLPARTGAPLGDMEVRIQGEANPVRLSDGSDPVSTDSYNTVYMGEAGVLIPQAQIGGSVYFAPIRYIELGGQFYWASYRWTRANNAGVLNLPKEHKRDVWIGGLGLRGNIPITSIDLTISLMLQIDITRIPEAEFLDASLLYPSQGYKPGFRFNRMYDGTWVFPGFFLQVDKGFLDSTLHLHFILGIERTLQNIGFDWLDRGQSTLENAAAIPIGVGLEYRYEWFIVGATLFYPLALGDRLDVDNFGPSLSIRMGVVLGGKREKEPDPSGEDGP